MNASYRMYRTNDGPGHTWLSHVKNVNESSLTYKWVTSHIWMAHVNEHRSTHTNLRLISEHLNHTTSVYKSHKISFTLAHTYPHTCTRVRAHTHTHTHTYIHTHIHTHTCTRTRAYTKTPTHSIWWWSTASSRLCTHIYITCLLPRQTARVPTQPPLPLPFDTHTLIHTHTHTRTHR